jgi:hypothetical protein
MKILQRNFIKIRIGFGKTSRNSAIGKSFYFSETSERMSIKIYKEISQDKSINYEKIFRNLGAASKIHNMERFLNIYRGYLSNSPKSTIKYEYNESELEREIDLLIKDMKKNGDSFTLNKYIAIFEMLYISKNSQIPSKIGSMLFKAIKYPEFSNTIVSHLKNPDNHIAENYNNLANLYLFCEELEIKNQMADLVIPALKSIPITDEIAIEFSKAKLFNRTHNIFNKEQLYDLLKLHVDKLKSTIDNPAINKTSESIDYIVTMYLNFIKTSYKFEFELFKAIIDCLNENSDKIQDNQIFSFLNSYLRFKMSDDPFFAKNLLRLFDTLLKRAWSIADLNKFDLFYLELVLKHKILNISSFDLYLSQNKDKIDQSVGFRYIVHHLKFNFNKGFQMLNLKYDGFLDLKYKEYQEETQNRIIEDSLELRYNSGRDRPNVLSSSLENLKIPYQKDVARHVFKFDYYLPSFKEWVAESYTENLESKNVILDFFNRHEEIEVMIELNGRRRTDLFSSSSNNYNIFRKFLFKNTDLFVISLTKSFFKYLENCENPDQKLLSMIVKLAVIRIKAINSLENERPTSKFKSTANTIKEK